MTNTWLIRAVRVAPAALGLLLFSLAAPCSRAETATGEQWETTVQMEMSGAQSFAMPATKSKVCRPKGEAWDEPPAPDNSECTTSDVTRSGNTMTWSMECTRPKATGTGTMTFDGDASYTGDMKITTAEGTMVMRMSGHRTGVECDPGAVGRQVKAMHAQMERQQAQASQSMATACAEMAAKGQAQAFLGPQAMCKEPEQMTAFCRALSTETGYTGVKANAAAGVDLAQAARACHVDEQKIHDDLCVKANASESFDFLVKECPAQAQVLAQHECAGRQYTQLAGTKYAGFCSRYAQAEMERPEAENEAADAKKTAMDKAKKGLRGLFHK